MPQRSGCVTAPKTHCPVSAGVESLKFSASGEIAPTDTPPRRVRKLGNFGRTPRQRITLFSSQRLHLPAMCRGPFSAQSSCIFRPCVSLSLAFVHTQTWAEISGPFSAQSSCIFRPCAEDPFQLRAAASSGRSADPNV